MPLKKDSLYRIEFRVYDRRTGLMYTWDNPGHRVLIAAVVCFKTGGDREFDVSQWTGQFDDSEKPVKIFNGDIIEADIANEFGSISKLKGIIGYDLAKMSFFPTFERDLFEFEHIETVRVIGDAFRNPEYVHQIGKTGDLKYE